MSKFVSRAAYYGLAIYAGATGLLHRGQLWDSLNAAGVLTDVARNTVTATGALLTTQCGILEVDATAGNIVLTLPASGVATDEAVYEVHRLDQTTNTVTFAAAGADTIDGLVTVGPLGSINLKLPAGKTVWRVSKIGGRTAAAARRAISAGDPGYRQNVVAKLAANGSSVTFTADYLNVGTAAAGFTQQLSAINKVLDISTVGAGGMDVALAPSTAIFVAIYSIAKPDGTHALLGCNAATSTGSKYSGANMPAGYTDSELIGIWLTNNAVAPLLLAGAIFDRKYFYQLARSIVSGGTFTSTLTSQSVSVAVPPAAKAVDLQFLIVTNATYKVQSASDASGFGIQITSGAQDATTRASGGGMPSSYASAHHPDVRLATAQTVFVADLGSGGADTLYVTGYAF